MKRRHCTLLGKPTKSPRSVTVKSTSQSAVECRWHFAKHGPSSQRISCCLGARDSCLAQGLFKCPGPFAEVVVPVREICCLWGRKWRCGFLLLVFIRLRVVMLVRL
ncbi:hypothetical protein CDAR_481031 [Caerostris darwini]|uniref:Uncharacterized protein n=1 Tax=Caerostris darwini TaxID=1538125 RepID=A0AAV4W4T8_9ARAC|nr:hypothetical protein CDAR_481031 [Caerostris darwini]